MRAVLMLHSIDPSGSTISLSGDELRALVRGVLASGHSIVPLGELLEGSSRNAIALTFDDGLASLAEVAAPLLREEGEGAVATLFLTTGFVGRDNHWPSQPAEAPRLPMLDWQGVERLHQAGWEIEAHTHSHPDLRNVTPDELAEELEAPRDEITQRLGRTPQAFAYPYGLLDSGVVDAVANHYTTAVTTCMAGLPDDPGDEVDRLRIPRLDAYYLRQPSAQRLIAGSRWPGGFGGPGFRGLMALRAALRRWHRHPGENT